MTASAAPHAAVVAIVTAPFGAVTVECCDGAVSGLRLLAAAAPQPPTGSLAQRVVEQLQRYFDDPNAAFDLPLAIRGSAFQRAVWQAIAAIPPGQTRRYGELADALGVSARAVGQACGDNRLPLVIPCHRVIAASGLGGFAHAKGGFALRAKHWLLEHEGALRGALI